MKRRHISRLLSFCVLGLGCGGEGTASEASTDGVTEADGGETAGAESSSNGGDGDGTSGDGDGTSGDGDGTSGDGDGTSGDGDATSGDGDSTSGDGDGTTGVVPGDCGWDAGAGFYECGYDGAIDPSMTYPYACPSGLVDNGGCMGVQPQGCCDSSGNLFWCDAMSNSVHYIPCAGCMATGSICTEHAQCCSGGCLAATGRCT